MWYEARKLAADELVKPFEGLRLNAYLCSANKWTIGYGHTQGVTKGMSITREKADHLLAMDLEQADAYIDEYVKADLNVNQRAALISWVFNLGPGNLSSSTMLKKLNKLDYKGAANEMLRWVYADKKKLKGLERRRKAERELFLMPIVEKPMAVKAKQVAPVATTAVVAGAGGVEILQQVGAAAPAVSVGKEVAETAQSNPTGLIIIVLLVVIAIGGFLAWRKIKKLEEVRNA